MPQFCNRKYYFDNVSKCFRPIQLHAWHYIRCKKFLLHFSCINRRFIRTSLRISFPKVLYVLNFAIVKEGNEPLCKNVILSHGKSMFYWYRCCSMSSKLSVKNIWIFYGEKWYAIIYEVSIPNIIIWGNMRI